jgi:hypothetical protein
LILTFVAAAGAATATGLLWQSTKDLVTGADAAAERQLRAYVYLAIDARAYPPPPDTPNRYAVSLSVTNGGKTWARNLAIRNAVVSRQLGVQRDPWNTVKWNEMASQPLVLGPSQTLHLQYDEIKFPDLSAIEKGNKRFDYVVWVQYEDVISSPSVPRQTQLYQRLHADTEGPIGHISFAYLPTHNCADGDCPK